MGRTAQEVRPPAPHHTDVARACRFQSNECQQSNTWDSRTGCRTGCRGVDGVQQLRTGVQGGRGRTGVLVDHRCRR